MGKTLPGAETAKLLNKGADYIQAMAGSVGFDWLTAGPTADVPVNPGNPLKIQIILSSNSEETQQLDLERMAKIIGGPELTAQTENPVSSLSVPVRIDDGIETRSQIHVLDLYEALFTTDEGIDVSLTAIGGDPMVTTERRHSPSETPEHIRKFAEFIGGTALGFSRVNIRLRDPGAIQCHAHANYSSMAGVRKAAETIDPKVLGEWEGTPDYGHGSEGLTSRAEVDGAKWQVSIYPDL